MNRNWLWLWVLLLGGGMLLIFHYMDKNNQRIAAAQAKIHPKNTTSQTDPVNKVDTSITQPVIQVQTGKGVEYHTAVATPPPSATPEEVIQDLQPMVLVDYNVTATPTPSPTPTPVPRAQTDDERWLPEGVFIPCILQNEVDSGHMGIPIELVVTENIYQRNLGQGHIIIPAGSRLLSFADFGYHRDRITADGEWHCIFVNDGTSVSFEGILCDMEYDVHTNQYGLYDKSPGIKGKLIESDMYVRLKNFIGLLLGVTATAVDQLPQELLQKSQQSTSIQINPNTTSLDQYIQKIINGHNTDINDTLFVQVPATKGCWVMTKGPVEPGLRSMGSRLQASRKKPAPLEDTSSPSPIDPKWAENLLQKYEQLHNEQLQKSDETTGSSSHFGE